MQCARCRFENMPGLTTCFQCGSVLELSTDQAAVNIYPPRAPAWAKPLRALRRWFRRNVGTEKVEDTTPEIIRAVKRIGQSTIDGMGQVLEAFIALLVATIPALPHLRRGRFTEIRLYFYVWIALIVLGLFWYGSPVGLFLIGLALGLHGWIAVLGWNLLTSDSTLGERVGATLATVALLGLLYWFVGHQIAVRFPGAHIAFAIPYQRVQTGDYLVGRPITSATGLKRGDLVIADIVPITNYGYPMDAYEVAAQIIGLGGETVSIRDDAFYVNGKRLDSQVFPFPAWLRGRNLTVRTPEKCVFISTEYNLIAHGMNLNEDFIHRACLVKWEAIRARVSLRWLPITRRGFLKDPP